MAQRGAHARHQLADIERLVYETRLRRLQGSAPSLRYLLVVVAKKRAPHDANAPRTKFNDFSTLSLPVRAVFCRVVPRCAEEMPVKWWAL